MVQKSLKTPLCNIKMAPNQKKIFLFPRTQSLNIRLLSHFAQNILSNILCPFNQPDENNIFCTYCNICTCVRSEQRTPESLILVREENFYSYSTLHLFESLPMP